MNDRFLNIKIAMQEAMREGGITCGACEQPIFGPKVTVVRGTVPRKGESPSVEVTFVHGDCAKGGELNG